MNDNKLLVINPGEFYFDREGYDFTKVLGLRCYTDGRLKVIRKQPTTWASLVREVINAYSYEIDTLVDRNYSEFEFLFNNALEQMLRSWGGRTNTSFSERLFRFPINVPSGEYPEHIRSSVYKNNANSLLKIFEIPDSTEADYITAVYSGEVVWILNALITSLEEFNPRVEIEYIKRDDIGEQTVEEDEQLSIDDIQEQTNDSIDKSTIKGAIKDIRYAINELYKSGKINLDEYRRLDTDLDVIFVKSIQTEKDIKSIKDKIDYVISEY